MHEELALKLGIEPGDRITAIDDEPVQSWSDLLAVVQSRPGEAVEVSYTRNGADASVDLVLGEDGSGEDRRGVIGIELMAAALLGYGLPLFIVSFLVLGAFQVFYMDRLALTTGAVSVRP